MPSFSGPSIVSSLLALVEPVFPKLVSGTVPDPVSPFVFTDVLRRLLAEGVCIRDLRRILLTLADFGRIEQDPLMLTEYVRVGLKRQMTHVLSRGTNRVVVFLLHPSIERSVREAIVRTATGSYLDLPPRHLAQILQAIQRAVQTLPPGVQMPHILAPLEIRSSIRRLVAPTLPRLHAVSYHELRDDASIEPIGRITLDGFERRPGVSVGGVPLWD